MKIGSVSLESPLAVAPMAGMTDSAFRRLVKRHGGCGLVVTEMVSSEGLVRGIDRTLEYAEYTDEERPVSIQIFGGDPETDGGGRSDRRGHGRRYRGRQYGLPRAENREAQRRLQPDERTRACRQRHRRDGEGREDSRDRQDACGLERPRPQRFCAGEDGGRCRRRGGRRPRAHGGAELQRSGRLGPRGARGRRADDSGLWKRRLRRARSDRRAPRLRNRGRVGGTRCPPESVDPGAGAGFGRRPSDARGQHWKIAAVSFSTTSTFC